MKSALLVGLALLTTTAIASAQERRYAWDWREPREYMANRGIQLGARVGLTGGVGKVYSGLPIMDSMSGALPITVDVGWRMFPFLYMGIVGTWAPVFMKQNEQSCPYPADCHAYAWRLGAQADFHVAPRSSLDPYIGLGIGYEVLQTSIDTTRMVPVPGGALPANVSANVVDRGWEFAALTLGLDARVNKFLGIGPYVSAAVGVYDVHEGDINVSANGMTLQQMPIPAVNHVAHGIGTIGLRGTFNP